MAVFEFPTRVSYDDVDTELKLSLRGVLGLMQEAAIIHSDQIGYSVNNVSDTHVVWMLVQWRVRITGAAFWNEKVTVRTWPRTMERVTSERDFEIVNADGEQIAIGESLWTLVGADTGRITRITKEISDSYELTDIKVFDSELGRLEDIPTTETYKCMVGRRDIDTNHHVNNRVYLDYAFEAIPDFDESREFREVFIRYRKQLLLSQPVCCFHGFDNGVHLVNILGNDNELHATVMLR